MYLAKGTHKLFHCDTRPNYFNPILICSTNNFFTYDFLIFFKSSDLLLLSLVLDNCLDNFALWPRLGILVHAGLCQEEDGGGGQEGSRGEVDGVVAERHDDHHVGQEGGQKAEGEKNSSEAEQALLGSGLEAPHPHRRADQVPQKKQVE